MKYKVIKAENPKLPVEPIVVIKKKYSVGDEFKFNGQLVRVIQSGKIMTLVSNDNKSVFVLEKMEEENDSRNRAN